MFQKEKKMAKRINIMNLKGGVGKTETALNLAYGLAKNGNRVLYIPLDPQSDAQENLLPDYDEYVASKYEKVKNCLSQDGYSYSSARLHQALNAAGYSKERDYPRTIAELLTEKSMTNSFVMSAVLPTKYENFWLIPASEGLIGTQQFLFSVESIRSGEGKERLKRALDCIDNDFDYVIIDNSPFDSILSENALQASLGPDGLTIIPVSLSDRSLNGLTRTLGKIVEYVIYDEFDVRHKILITMKNRNAVHKRWGDVFGAEDFSDLVFKTSIRYQSKPVEDATLNGQILLETKQQNGVKEDYENLLSEIIEYFEN